MSVKTELILQDKMSSVIRDINRNLGNTIKAMDGVEKAGNTSFGGKLAKAAAVTSAAFGAAATAVKGAVVAIGKQSLDAYADFQQLKGGVETLFGDETAKIVAENASKAFETAGLSANQYMETVTGFSASLLQSVGGDTVKAAKMADMAVRDMSDNANKMGSDMASIQNAYQGFAKQNYTMLDNLKLGYGGTKEEMQRLLEDAEKLSGVKYDISSYADIVDAIHVIQDEMGIAGATADEAVSTISGSINMLKGSWQNLLTGLGDPSADIGKLANDVISSVITVGHNILPALQNIFSSIPQMVESLGDGLLSAVDELSDSLGNLIGGLSTAVLKLLPKVAKTGVRLVISLVNSIGNQLPQLIPIAVEAIVTLTTGLIENLPMILDAALQLIMGLAQGLLDALPTLIAQLPTIIVGICDFLLSAIPQIIQAGVELLGALIDNSGAIITAIVSALPEIINGLVLGIISHLGEILGAGLQLFVGLKMALPMIIMQIIASIPEMVSNMIQSFISFVGGFKDAGIQLIKGLWNGIKDTVGWVVDRIKGLGTTILNAVKSIFHINSPSKETEWIGQMLGQGLANGITSSASDAVQASKAMSADVLSSVGDMNATAKIGTEYTGSAFTVGGGNYSPNNVNVVVNVDMSGMQNSIANGNDMDDMVTRLVNGIRMKTATAMQGVV